MINWCKRKKGLITAVVCAIVLVASAPAWASDISKIDNVQIVADNDGRNPGHTASGEYIELLVSGPVVDGSDHYINTRFFSDYTHIYVATQMDSTLNVSGTITGNLTGNVTGNASTATNATYATTAGAVDAGNLTGTTLASNVVNSSLTSVGNLTGLDVDGTTTLTSALNGHSITVSNAGTTVAGGLTVSSSGASITGGIDNNTGGITNAGAISGATSAVIDNIHISDATSGENNISGVTTYYATDGTRNTITMDGTTGNITAGNTGNAGAIYVKDASNHSNVTLDGVGGTSSGGQVTVANGSGTTQITLDGGNGNMTSVGGVIQTGTGAAAISLDGSNGNASIGGNLDMTNGSVNNVATLNAYNGTRNTVVVNGNNTGNGLITVGNTTGNSESGAINLTDGSNNSITLAGSTGIATIGNAAHSGTIKVVDASGTTGVQLTGAGAGTFGNLTDTAGSINVTNGATGYNTVTLNGTGGTVANSGLMTVQSAAGTTTVKIDSTGSSGGGQISVDNSAGYTNAQINGAGTMTLGNTSNAGHYVSGALSLANGTAGNNGIVLNGAGGTNPNTGLLQVNNSSGNAIASLNGSGSSVIANGFAAYSAGTAASHSGSNGIIVTGSGNSNTLTVGNTADTVMSFTDDTAAHTVFNRTVTNGSSITGGASIYAGAGAVSDNSISVTTTKSTTVNGNTVNYGTYVNGGMLVDGSLGVNGNIYTLKSDANASINVANNGLNIAGATNDVTLTSDNNGAPSDGRAQLNLTPTTGSMLVTNTGTGHTEGISIGQTETVVSGGTHSTSVTYNDWGATFKNDETGGPARVTGIADGSEDYDAVNYRQLKDIRNAAYAGSANAAALAAIPPVAPGKTFSLGAGYGNYKGMNAIATGVKVVVGSKKDIILSGGVSHCDREISSNAGLGYSW